MLTLITGVPGACKTAYTVDQLDQLEKQNFINVRKNKVIFEHNKDLYEKFRDQFSFLIVEEGSGYDLKHVTVYLEDDYFDFLMQDFDDLRPDFYYQRSIQYNEIIDRINDSYGEQKFELLRPVRTIYSNINALKIPYVRSLIRDWRDAPDGSVFAIDEVQNLEPYSDKKSQDKIIQDLTIHRHRGFDFYFITQYPNLLHPTVKALIGCHNHLTKPFGWTTRIYRYGSCRDNPNAMINKFNYEAKFKYKPHERLFKLYKSTTINTHTKRIPAFIYVIGCFVVLMGLVFWHFATKDNAIIDQVTGAKTAQDYANESKKNFDTSKNASGSNSSQDSALSDMCRVAANVDKPECKKWFDDLSKNGGSVSPTGQVTTVSYDPSKPYDFKPQAQIQVRDYPRLSGCARNAKGQYLAIDQQGNIMPDVSQSDCKKWISGYRPFDYSRSPVEVKNNAPVSAETNYSQSRELAVQEVEEHEQTKSEGLI
ncbi:zonular occludens toxin domain-containing protein [Acinetobacter sp. ANC 7200]|uniref:zonular occludens toxin domain-containing protein n=1 Tax=Acinetobacter amyesii TaxID=2942470 RepID=UPI0020C06861|nr:zonular occludens toxin domain-containing protein [Acinetobacter amyesii]MCL6244040.1 zonular occludens toxin domain-containing protein [Acinetobacter amyesii]